MISRLRVARKEAVLGVMVNKMLARIISTQGMTGTPGQTVGPASKVLSTFLLCEASVIMNVNCGQS